MRFNRCVLALSFGKSAGPTCHRFAKDHRVGKSWIWNSESHIPAWLRNHPPRSNIEGNEKRLGLPTVEATEKAVRERLLDPTAAMMPFEVRAILRTELRMPPEIVVPTAGTNAPAGATNAPVAPPGK